MSNHFVITFFILFFCQIHSKQFPNGLMENWGPSLHNVSRFSNRVGSKGDFGAEFTKLKSCVPKISYLSFHWWNETHQFVWIRWILVILAFTGYFFLTFDRSLTQFQEFFVYFLLLYLKSLEHNFFVLCTLCWNPLYPLLQPLFRVYIVEQTKMLVFPPCTTFVWHNRAKISTKL